MRSWLPLVAVSAFVVALLVAGDPEAVGLGGLRCAPSGGHDAWTLVPEEEFIGPCRVLRVIDGDTLDVACDGPEERIRLLRVDTPEREERGYGEARDALRRLVGRREVRLLLEEPGEPVRDRHGRLLAYVYQGERNANAELVRLGWSHYDERFGAGRFGRAFRAAEAEARAAERGLWAEAADP